MPTWVVWRHGEGDYVKIDADRIEISEGALLFYHKRQVPKLMWAGTVDNPSQYVESGKHYEVDVLFAAFNPGAWLSIMEQQ